MGRLTQAVNHSPTEKEQINVLDKDGGTHDGDLNHDKDIAKDFFSGEEEEEEFNFELKVARTQVCWGSNG